MTTRTASSYVLLDNGKYAIQGQVTTNGAQQGVQCIVDGPISSIEEATEKLQTYNFNKHLFKAEGIYNVTLDAYILPRPFLSWVFNYSTYDWDPPVPLPDDGNEYIWDELNSQWVEVE